MAMRDKMKRIGALLLTMAVLMAALTGCGSGGLSFGKPKDPTAKELVEGASDPAAGGYADMSLDMTVKAAQDGVDTTLDMTMGVEASGDVAHVYDGEMTIGAEGFSMSIKLEGWTDVKSGESYVRASMMGDDSGWMKTDNGGMGLDSFTDMTGTDWLKDDDSAYELREHKKGEDWVVTWTVPGDAFDRMLEDAEDGLMGGSDTSFKGDLLVEAHFDEESHELKTLAVGGNADGMELACTVTIKSTGDKTLEIPAKVIEEAAMNETNYDDGMDSGFSHGGDDEDWYGTEDARIVSDGDGSDDFMDAFAQTVLDAGYAQGPIHVYHYSYETEVSWDWQDGGTGDLMIGAEASHILPNDFGSAEDEFRSDCEFTMEWLGVEDAFKGSPAEGWAAYFVDKDYCCELDYLAVYPDKDLVVSVDVYSYEDGATADDLWLACQQFLAAHGL